jgi:hypothetical protein
MTCPTEKTYVPYNGPALPGNAESIVLFSSTAAFGPRAAPHYRCYWVDVALQTDQAAGTQTVALQKSVDGGTNWITVGTPTNVASGHTSEEFFVSPYQDFRILYLNGTTPQTAFAVDLVIDHTSRSAAP